MQKGMIRDEMQIQYQKPDVSHEVPKSNAHYLKKEIVIHIVKQSLLASGGTIIELVGRSLCEKYSCEIEDCFERPQYLVDVLKFVYDGSYPKIVDSIKKNLGQFSEESGIKEFIQELEISI